MLIHSLSCHTLTLDLAYMGSSYGYHTGLVFCVYAKGWHNAVVRGGRYDGIGKLYGRERPATGFCLDLRALSAGGRSADKVQAIQASCGTETELLALIDSLRSQCEVVLQLLPDEQPGFDEFVITQQIVSRGQQWQVEPCDETPPTVS